MAKAKTRSRIKDPHGKDMDYKVEKLKPMTPERKAAIDANAKAKARPKPAPKKAKKK
jgi:hypothetical protein